MKPLPEIDKEKLRAAGRQDLIDTHELLMSGYAGVVYCPSVNRKVTSIDYYNGWFVRGIGEVKNPDKITHWQPLPTQPTEPSNETK